MHTRYVPSRRPLRTTKSKQHGANTIIRAVYGARARAAARRHAPLYRGPTAVATV